MSPRSILKHSSASQGVPTMAQALPYHPPPPQVHFPPTTALTQTHYTHSGAAYDRAPIVVMPNDCAMPERGCRTYTGKPMREGGGGGDGRNSSSAGVGKHPHPRAVDASSDGRIPTCYGPAGGPYHHSSSSTSSSSSNMMMALRTGPPPLVPDLSSESDESDGVVSPPPEYYTHSHAAAHGPSGHHSSSYGYGGGSGGGGGMDAPSQEQLDKALAFLPHAPPSSKPKREERKRRSETRFKSADASRSFASSSLDGCLGGF